MGAKRDSGCRPRRDIRKMSLRLALPGAPPATNLPPGVPLHSRLTSTTRSACISISSNPASNGTCSCFCFHESSHPGTKQFPPQRRLTYIRLNHLLPSSVSPTLRHHNTDGKNDKLQGVPPDRCKMNGSCRGRDPPCCFGSGG